MPRLVSTDRLETVLGVGTPGCSLSIIYIYIYIYISDLFNNEAVYAARGKADHLLNTGSRARECVCARETESVCV